MLLTHDTRCALDCAVALLNTEPHGGRPDLQRLAATVEERTRQAIEADRKVYASQHGDRRVVGIDGMHEDPCGGTHVTSLGQLAGFSLRSVKVKGGVLKVGYVVEHV